MRTFDYKEEVNRLLTHRSVGQIGTAYEFMGKKKTIQQSSPDTIGTLVETTLLHTVAAGVRNNGIGISFEKVKALVGHTEKPQNEAEYSVVRYARALSSINNNEYTHDNMMEDIRRLNSLLFYEDYNEAQSQWRVHDTPYQALAAEEAFAHRLPPYGEAKALFRRICEEYTAVIDEGVIHPLYAMSVFFLDYIAIQPFDRGNFEMIRLVLSYLLHWVGLTIMDVVSMEHCLQKHMHQKGQMTNSLKGWHTGENDYAPVFALCMKLVEEAHHLFSQWTGVLLKGSFTAKDIVMMIIRLSEGNITKRMIEEYAPFLSESSIELSLYSLKKEGLINKLGGGRYSEYSYNAQAT